MSEKSIRKKGANPARRPCLRCMAEGKTRNEAMFDSLDPSDRFCPLHKIAKSFLNCEHYTADDFNGGVLL